MSALPESDPPPITSSSMFSISRSMTTPAFGGTKGGTPPAPYAYAGSVTRTVDLSPSLMVLMATSQPRIIDPSIATTRCRSDLANGLSDPEAVQRYLTTTASPGRTTRPVPSTTVVLDTPDDGGEEEDDVELSLVVVVVVLVDVAVVASSMPLVVDARSGRRADGDTWEEEKASVVPTRERRQIAANNSGWTEGCTMVDDDERR